MRLRTWIFWSIMLGGLLLPDAPGHRTATEASLEERIGQMLMVGFRGTSVDSDSSIVQTLRDINLGGVVLFDFDVPSQSFPRNIVSPDQTRHLIQALQATASTPLLVAVDAEGGRINRLKSKYGFIDIPSAQALGRTDVAECRIVFLRLAEQLIGLGFNLNLAPVVDLNLNPANPVIGSLERSFGPNPEGVIARATAFIDAHRSRGVITALKHFPGHGSSRGDSHLGMVDVTDSYQERELQPFLELIRAGAADMIMTAHVVNRRIESRHPATLSSAFLDSLLRKRLGFEGVIISDDLQMGAIGRNYGFEQALILAVNAGCDILAIANNGDRYDEQAAHKAHRILVRAVERGEIPRSRIDASYLRIIRLKRRYGIIR